VLAAEALTDTIPFGWVVLGASLVGLVAVMSNRLSERLRVPAPALFLAGAAVAAELAPSLHDVPHRTVERVVTVALVFVLFDGGMHIGRSRFRSAAGAIGLVGILGTFGTAAAVGALAHYAFGLGWWVALLVGTAVAPTDPAVVFSVLGRREVAGRSGVILEGESGANDPVGIALMASLLAAGGVGAGALGHVVAEFATQMAVGAAIGVVGGRLLLEFMRRVPLPSEGLYPLRALATCAALFGVATVARGSGFLAVFLAGVVIGDEGAPYKREIQRFHAALASLGEIAAFIILGITVRLGVLSHADVWVPGVVIATVLALVARPLLVGLCLVPVRLTRSERAFVLWAGLKGAVPILLGSFLLSADVPQAQRLYGIVVVVVAYSVIVQAGTVPLVARLLRLPMRTVEPEPWALGVRLRDEPSGAHRFRVARGSPADGCAIRDLSAISDDVWVSFVIRSGELVPVRGGTELRAGDEVLLLGDPEARQELAATFTSAARPSAPSPAGRPSAER
jgi:cell volume regulation protein A